MKFLVSFLILAISISVSYCLGYYNAVNDTAFLLHTNSAMSSIATINYLEKGSLDKIKKLHLIDAEASMAAVEDIFKLRGNITKIPRRFIQYYSLSTLGTDFEKQTLDSLRPKYARIVAKTEAKPNTPVEQAR